MNSGQSLQVSIEDLGGSSDLDEQDLLGELIGFDGEHQRIQTIVYDVNANFLQDLWADQID